MWSVGSSLIVYPHSLSYFNELEGGPSGSADHSLNSNIDWGQDLRCLKWWREKHRGILKSKPYNLAYDGLVDPAELGFEDTLPWPSKKDAIPEETSSLLTPGFYAINVNILRGEAANARDGQVRISRMQPQILRHFCGLNPCGRAGYSILIYEIKSAETN